MLAVALLVALTLWGAAPAALAAPEDEIAPPAHAYSAQGLEIEGGASLAQAPSVEPGIHRDSFALAGDEPSQEGTVKYYRVAVQDGQRVHAAATIAAPPVPGGLPEERSSLAVNVSFLTAGGDACDGERVTDIGESYTGDGPITTAAVSEVLGPDGCTGSELFVRVAREGTRAAGAALPVEVQIAIQPAGIGGGAPSVEEPLEEDAAAPTAPESSEPLELGRSFQGAAEVEPGSYVIELVPGETGLVAIDVAEGQRLRWRTEITSVPEEQPGAIALRAFDPARSQVTVGGGSWSPGSAGTVSGGGMRAPVDIGNRGSEHDSVRSAWLPGTHVIQLQRLQRESGADPAGEAPLTLILTLELEGEAAEDAAEGTVLELGQSGGGLWSAESPVARTVLLIAAAALGLFAVVLAAAGVLVLRRR